MNNSTSGAGTTWAPLTITDEGVEEIHPGWVHENLDQLTLVDVREPAEFDGPVGHIQGALLVPLAHLASSVDSIPTDKPVVMVCHVGGRSALGWGILRQLGFDKVANLTGGMVYWHANGLPVRYRD